MAIHQTKMWSENTVSYKLINYQWTRHFFSVFIQGILDITYMLNGKNNHKSISQCHGKSATTYDINKSYIMCMYINTSIHWLVLCYGTLKIDALLLIQCKGCVKMVKILYQDMQPSKTKWGSFALEMSCWMTTKEMKLLFSCHLLRCASYQCLWRLSSTASKLQTFIILLYKRLALSNSNNICN